MNVLITAHTRVLHTLSRPDGERGDVPGWVLITIMTAGLVTLIWALAGNAFQTMFNNAMSSVTGPK
ncbi:MULTISPECIES: hypothetical protein [unclassified Janibacter]|uniref:hypothetical protein n=1 Tax=unclassified Janibacter TaxID=2649294 RepID=UPI003D0132C5